jgi:hypothetical protein
MSNLSPKRTGLPFVVWISAGAWIQNDDIRVKITRGPKVKSSEMISVALRPMLRVIDGQLSNEELGLLEQWVQLNLEVLIDYWNGEIDTSGVLERLKGI